MAIITNDYTQEDSPTFTSVSEKQILLDPAIKGNLYLDTQVVL